MALDLLEYGMMNQAGFNVITGEIGTGKTTLMRHVLNQLDRDVTVGLISNTHRSLAMRKLDTSSLLRPMGCTTCTPSGPTRTRSLRAALD